MHPATIDRDVPGPAAAGSSERSPSLAARRGLGWDRRYLVGGVAGVLIGAALAVPIAYALPGISPDTASEPLKGRSDVARDVLLETGVRMLSLKDPEGALLVFRAAEILYPRDASVANDVCVALNELRRHEQAIEACEKALAIDPAFSLARNNLAWAQAQKAKARSAAGASAPEHGGLNGRRGGP